MFWTGMWSGWCEAESIQNAFAQTFKDLGYPTTMKQAVTETGDLVWQKNEVLKAENRSLKAKLEKAYDFMRQVTINGMNMLEHFLRSIGEWAQQKVAEMSR